MQLTVNVARRLRVLHKGNRRKRASDYLRQELVRFAKLDKKSIRISSDVNRLLLRGKLSELRKLELNIETKDGKAFVSLKKPMQAQNQKPEPDKQQKTEQADTGPQQKQKLTSTEGKRSDEASKQQVKEKTQKPRPKFTKPERSNVASRQQPEAKV